MSETSPPIPTFLHCHTLFKGPPPVIKSKAYPWEWWAVHVPTLTPIRISLRGVRLHLQWAYNAIPLHASHPEAHATLRLDEPRLANQLATELAANFDKPIRLVKSSPIPTDHPELPEHLLVFDLNGEIPAIWRSADPRTVLPVVEMPPDDDVSPIGELIGAIFGPTEVLGTSLSWSEEIVIRVPGHLYYYQECEAALEELRIEFLGEAQMEARRNTTQARIDALWTSKSVNDLRKAFGDSFDFSGFFADPADLPPE